MTTLGLTGGIGSGKSAAAAHFAALGAYVVVADGLAKRLMVEDAALREALKAEFGAEIYLEDGSLDRKHLAGQVFGDAARLAALNALVHPAVYSAFPAQVAEAEAAGHRLLVYETAILFESGGADRFDHTAVVDAPVETRIARVMARDGVSRAAVLARMAHQFDPEDLRARADFVLDNGDTLAHLQSQVAALYAHLTAPAP